MRDKSCSGTQKMMGAIRPARGGSSIRISFPRAVPWAVHAIWRPPLLQCVREDERS